VSRSVRFGVTIGIRDALLHFFFGIVWKLEILKVGEPSGAESFSVRSRNRAAKGGPVPARLPLSCPDADLARAAARSSLFVWRW